MPEESRDTERGIQNVQQRVSNVKSRETVGERHLRGGKWGPKAANDDGLIQAANDEYAYAALIAAKEDSEREAQQQSRIQHAIREKGKKMLLKKALKGKKIAARQAIRWSIGIALSAYLLQILFAIAALVGFGAKALTDTNFITRIIASVLHPEVIGYIFWGLGLVLSIVLLLGYLMFFLMIGVSVFQSSIMVVIMIACFAFNITPGLNILPWLVGWIIYMSLFSSSD